MAPPQFFFSCVYGTGSYTKPYRNVVYTGIPAATHWLLRLTRASFGLYFLIFPAKVWNCACG